jgi:hypothetical protein
MATNIAAFAKMCVSSQVGEWSLRSGIQEVSGGVARYHYSDRRQNAAVSTEITGYFASSLISLYKAQPDQRYLDAALKAAGFLVKSWDEQCSAMPFECPESGQRYSYFFDVGIIARGLLAAWRETGVPEFQTIARKRGDSLAADFVDARGDYAPIIELPTKKALTYEPGRWSRSPGCYQLKLALAWVELWDATQDDRYLNLYHDFLARAMKDDPDFLPGVSDDNLVMDRLHAYSYFLEGLLPSAHLPECAKALAAGIARATGYARRIAPQFLRSDVLAQVLRARMYASQFGVLSLDEEAAETEVALLQEFQSQDPDPTLKGGFWFGRKGDVMLPFMNPVSTAFAEQALRMWDQYREGERSFVWTAVI